MKHKKNTFLRRTKAFFIRGRRTLRPLEPWFRRLKTVAPYAGAILFLAALSVAAARHEMWRDELQAWLLAKEAPTPWGVFHYIRYDGHPGLWHFLLWFPAHCFENPAAMQVLHVLIAGGSAFLILRFAPFGWLFRILIVCGYYFSYEWAVISRNYAISALLVLLICVLHKNRWKNFLWTGGTVFLLCHTNIGGIIFSIVYAVMESVDFAVASAGKFRGADRWFKRTMAGFLIMAAGIATGIAQVAPPEDGSFAPNWTLAWNEPHFNNVMGTVHNAFFPVPPDRKNFWNANSLKSDKEVKPAWLPAFEKKDFMKTGAMILLCLLVVFIRRPWCGLLFLGTAAAEILFYYVKYGGSWRHHGWLYLCFLACFWMSYSYNPWRIPFRIPELAADFLDRHRAWVLLPLFAVQILGASRALKNDWNEPFSMAKQTAEQLKNEFPEWKNCFFATPGGPVSSTLSGYLGVPFFHMDIGGYHGAIIWRKPDGKWKREPAPAAIAHESERNGKDCILVVHQKLGEAESKQFKFLFGCDGAIVSDERYFLYYWKQPDAKKEDSGK